MSIIKSKTLMSFLIFVFISLFPQIANAYTITDYLEMVIVPNVGNSWTTLTLENTYTNPVVACTYNLPSDSHNEGAPRVQVISSVIQVRVQRPLNSAVTASDVYCTISQAGSFTSPIKYEAHIVTSALTNNSTDWGTGNMIDLVTTSTKLQSYDNPVILGQVMSDNDPNYVTFWSTACSTRYDPATDKDMCVGKHNGETNNTHAFSETLGVFIAEQDDYTLTNAHVKIALGANDVAGVDRAPPYDYDLTLSYTYGTATLSAMDGGDGGWAVLYGTDPITTSLNLAIDEDTTGTASNEPERNHVAEQVAYWVMEPIPHPEISLKKTVATVYDPVNLTTNPKSIPGAVLEYTLVGENSGDGPADDGTIVLTDLVPDNTVLCVADVSNCKAPYFIDGSTSSGLSTPALTYSDDSSGTIVYDYVPVTGAEGTDSLVTQLKAAMGGSFLPQTGTTAPSFNLKFRVIVE